ncbi:hypothetical protein [Cystobacter fuscus]|uniref:hypothetical protein n=1 Tax=Cystobacter fuscus TaxID=43 RepID=UPI002B2FC8BC|nr:hypothetical protein F0U63_41225 [Cystobacter fuscus]
MHDSLETPSTMRQRCPDSLSGAGVLALLALLLGGCHPSGWECLSSKDCERGLTCVHWEPGQTEESRYCARSCPVEADFCDDGRSCACPDSPLKKRCFDDDGQLIGVCE